jgi:hypothetical protein
MSDVVTYPMPPRPAGASHLEHRLVYDALVKIAREGEAGAARVTPLEVCALAARLERLGLGVERSQAPRAEGAR